MTSTTSKKKLRSFLRSYYFFTLTREFNFLSLSHIFLSLFFCLSHVCHIFFFIIFIIIIFQYIFNYYFYVFASQLLLDFFCVITHMHSEIYVEGKERERERELIEIERYFLIFILRTFIHFFSIPFLPLL